MRIALWTAVVLAGLSAGVARAQEVWSDGDDCVAGGAPGGGAAGRRGVLHHHHNGPRVYHWHFCGNRNALYRSQFKPWNGPYYDVSYGTPVAMVVPPTAERQSNYGWGVGNTRVSRIDHQFVPFAPVYPPGVPMLGAPLATPPWPSDTAQFGDYYVRAPW